MRSSSLVKFLHAACAASSILAAGYIFSILAHYRLIFGGRETYARRPRKRTTPLAEKIIVILTIVLAVIAFIMVFITLQVPAT